MKKTLGKFWNAYAGYYDILKEFKPYQELLNQIIEELDLKPCQKILDAGCGTGNLEEKLILSGILSLRIEGIDFSRQMINIAKKRVVINPNIKIFWGDLNECLMYPDNTFDRVVCVNVLYALNNPILTLNEFRRILKRDGKLILVNPYRANLKAPFQILTEHYRSLWTDRAPQKNTNYEILAKVIQSFPKILNLLIANLRIIKNAKKRKFYFFSHIELQNMIESAGLEIFHSRTSYADTVIIINAIKSNNKSHTSHIEIKALQTPEELDAAYYLRYQVYSEQLYSIDPASFPNQREKDEFDEYAFHFGAFEKGRLVGYVRFIRDSPHKFLLESDIVLPPTLDRSVTIEGSRLIGYKRNGNDIAVMLLAFAFNFTKSRGYKFWLAMWNRQLIMKHVAPFGVSWKALGKSIQYHNTKSVPYLLALEENIYQK